MYSSSSEFIQGLRRKLGIQKPTSLPMCHYKEGDITWEEWDAQLKQSRPWAFWVTETLPDTWDDIVRTFTQPFENGVDYIRNRFFKKYYALDSRLDRGKYYDLDHRILYGLFSEFEYYVEHELAWAHVMFSPEERQKYDVPKYFRRWRQWRCPEAGEAHLKWEMELVDEDDPPEPTFQAEAARRKWDLYCWWKAFKLRVEDDVFDVWHAFNDEMRKKYSESLMDLCGSKRTPEEAAYGNSLMKKAYEAEQARDREVDDKLPELISIRQTLWT